MPSNLYNKENCHKNIIDILKVYFLLEGDNAPINDN